MVPRKDTGGKCEVEVNAWDWVGIPDESGGFTVCTIIVEHVSQLLAGIPVAGICCQLLAQGLTADKLLIAGDVWASPRGGGLREGCHTFDRLELGDRDGSGMVADATCELHGFHRIARHPWQFTELWAAPLQASPHRLFVVAPKDEMFEVGINQIWIDFKSRAVKACRLQNQAVV